MLLRRRFINWIVCLIFAVLAISCGDSGSGGSASGKAPAISSIIVQPETIHPGEQLTITVNFSDPDGDVPGGMLYVDISPGELHQFYLDPEMAFPASWRLPDVAITYTTLPSGDTMTLTLVLEDAAGHQSDPKTVTVNMSQEEAVGVPIESYSNLILFGKVPAYFEINADSCLRFKNSPDIEYYGQVLDALHFRIFLDTNIMGVAGIKSEEDDLTPVFFLHPS